VAVAANFNVNNLVLLPILHGSKLGCSQKQRPGANLRLPNGADDMSFGRIGRKKPAVHAPI
jgi:hypothetical protein